MLRELDINEMNAVSGGWGPSGSTGGSTSGWSIPGDWDGNGVPDTNFGNDSGYFMGSTVGGEIGYSGGGGGGGTDATFTGGVSDGTCYTTPSGEVSCGWEELTPENDPQSIPEGGGCWIEDDGSQHCNI